MTAPDAPADRPSEAGAPSDEPLSREAAFSWLSGPRAAAADAGVPLGFRGQRLGYPEQGAGSVASFGRRLVAITVDWLACYLVAFAVVARTNRGGLSEVRLWNSTLFLVEVSLLTALGGASFGQRLRRIGVQRVDGTRLGALRCLLRTLLLMLVVPALIWDRDGRGLHDKAVGSVVVER